MPYFLLASGLTLPYHTPLPCVGGLRYVPETTSMVFSQPPILISMYTSSFVSLFISQKKKKVSVGVGEG